MGPDDFIECQVVQRYRHRFDAEQFAADLAKTPAAVERYAEELRVECPEVVVVYDSISGNELKDARRPVLTVYPRNYITVHLALFVKDAPAGYPPFDVDDGNLAVFESHETEAALDYAQNAVRTGAVPDYCDKLRIAGRVYPNGVVVRDHNRNELGRFLVRPKRTPGWFWRMIGWWR